MGLKSARPRQQQGSILLYTLVTLLLVFLALLYSLRGALTDTSLTDRFSERQKNTVSSDLALQYAANQIASVGTTLPLEIGATGQAWYLNVSATATVQPNAAYWATCTSSPTSTIKCAQVSMPSGSTQTAWFFVQPTGRVDASACNTQGMTAIYYDIWVHVIDARGQVATDTESMYKLCIL